MLRCAQSPSFNVLKLGIVEGWNDGLMGSNIPIFQHSNTPLRTVASEIFLSSLQTELQRPAEPGTLIANEQRRRELLLPSL
jgi:hypothetical protein